MSRFASICGLFAFSATVRSAIVLLAIVHPAAAAAAEPITLKVALYPSVPMPRDLFAELEGAFEGKHPGINVELVDTQHFNDDYYSGALLDTEADVYEVDTILLTDMIAAGKVQALDLPRNDYFADSIAAVTRNGKTYAVPHWLCGNLLFYRKADGWIGQAKSWDELIAAFLEHGRHLAVDFEGHSTLGEWYLTLLSNKLGLEEAEKRVLKSHGLDDEVVAEMRKILEACLPGTCRSRDLHDRTGYYSRAFVRGEVGAYVGYSESLHYGLQEALEDCRLDSCLSESDIAVRALPVAGNASEHGLGWVDGLAIDNHVSAAKLQAAKDFIAFLTSDDAYSLILEPEEGEAPRYLMPALPVTIEHAAMYPSLQVALEGRSTGTEAGLNARLRETSETLDCVLAAADKAAEAACEHP
ncbi:MAG TPA: extracellular solute-binding protein [Gammaproteobacteria bacterium]|nr:extracellular solute-binding protein [Gammaproteobacteria bacterium]